MNAMYKDFVLLPIDHVRLQGDLIVPDQAQGLVIFSHGSGSSRFSPRNKMVAEHLWKHRIATLLFDLLTEAEDQDYQNRFDIELLTKRLICATRWVQQQDRLKHLPIGYFGASTGAASALGAAAVLGQAIWAVVSRGGRPDLATEVLPDVTAPTLLLVGEWDEDVVELNRAAFHHIRAEKKMEIVSGAAHLFEEPGKLEEVAVLAALWFEEYLR